MNKLQKTAKSKSATSASGIVLFAKRPGRTSFSSLYTIKHAANTSKVGHTGTLDSFASGLLVVCVGSLTRLASRITAFDKTYHAVICFGEETDTLDPHGQIVKNSELPDFTSLQNAVNSFTGKIMQSPPAFSAIHINGKRASDLARSGKAEEIPARPVTVYNSQIIEIQTEDSTIYDLSKPDFNLNSLADKKVKYALVRFEVSKGTYIRCLARDIAKACNSCAHLVGLLRTKVGDFLLEEAAGFSLLDSFTIESVLKNLNTQKEIDEISLQQEVLEKMKSMDKALAKECGFASLNLLKQAEFSFYNGKPIKKNMFESFLISDDIEDEIQCAVFTEENVFAGIIICKNNKINYGYVVPYLNK